MKGKKNFVGGRGGGGGWECGDSNMYSLIVCAHALYKISNS